MSNSILKSWVMKDSAPRQTQVDVLEWVEELPAHIKYIIVEIPVGGGKSPLALTISAWMVNGQGSSCVLTPQKILQKQYEESFAPELIGSMYGKGNYVCHPKRTNCDIGDSIKPKCAECPYRANFNAAKAKPNIVMNYKIALLFSMIGVEFIKSRRLMIFDECHTLENHLTEFLAVTVSERMCKRYGVRYRYMKTLPEALTFLNDTYLPGMDNKMREVAKEAENIELRSQAGHPISKAEGEIVKEFEAMKEQRIRLETIVKMPMADLEAEYVYIPDKTFFRLKELYGKNIFKSLVDPLADRFVFMSSTILDKDEFCADIGIDPKRAAFISTDSEFPVENRPVLYMPTMKMTYGWDGPDKVQERKLMSDTIIDICNNQHPDDSGVIHTGSFVLANWLIKELQGKIPQKIMHHGSDSDQSRDETIKEFTNGDGRKKLLISPSVTEGLDLKGDLSRFNIIAKVPYPFLGDAWVKARMTRSQTWYNRQAMIAIIQACGRVVRSKDDWGNTYILDSSFQSLYNRIIHIIPKWWKNGFIKD